MSVLSLLPEDKRKELRKESLESVYSSNSRLNLLNKRKRMNPLISDNNMSQSVRSKSGDRFVTQRVLSAKTHRVKQLQNQLADAHYHLQELSNENRALRAVQKKQEIALQRYENSNADLPQVLNSHSEEMRVQQAKYKQLKAQCKEALLKLKERDMQLQMLRDEHQHLLELSKDRNLLEREKLQIQLTELSFKVQQQNETITMLQRRIALEAKNFKHQLQQEINKHRDTRADLDLAINNADKLSTIIEMKEKMLSTAASRSLKSPVKSASIANLARPGSRTRSTADTGREGRASVEQSLLAKLCENSRSLSSALSHDEDSSSTEPRSRTRTSSSGTRASPAPPPPPPPPHAHAPAPAHRNKPAKTPDDIIHLAKTVQDGMADLAIFDDELKTAPLDDVQNKMEAMKAELMNKIKSDESRRKPSALRRMSTEESIEEQIVESDEQERPRSRGRRNSNVSFFEGVPDETTKIHEYKTKPTEHKTEEVEATRPRRENSTVSERKLSGKPLDKYCKDIIQDIEKSSKVIDKHVKQFNTSRFENDKIVQQLQAVDKFNDLVNAKIEIPDEALSELNNNFKMLTEQVLGEVPVARKRSISGRKSRDSRSNLLGDVAMTNQDLLDDLLGKK